MGTGCPRIPRVGTTLPQGLTNEVSGDWVWGQERDAWSGNGPNLPFIFPPRFLVDFFLLQSCHHGALLPSLGLGFCCLINAGRVPSGVMVERVPQNGMVTGSNPTRSQFVFPCGFFPAALFERLGNGKAGFTSHCCAHANGNDRPYPRTVLSGSTQPPKPPNPHDSVGPVWHNGTHPAVGGATAKGTPSLIPGRAPPPPARRGCRRNPSTLVCLPGHRPPSPPVPRPYRVPR